MLIGLGFATLLLLAAAPLDADPVFVEGMRLFEDFEYRSAIERFERAMQEERPAAERARLWLLIGISHAELTEIDKASAAFERALELDGEGALPVQASPKIQQLFEEVRRKRPSGEAAEAANPGTEETLAVADEADSAVVATEPAAATGPGLLTISSLVVASVGAIALVAGGGAFAWGFFTIGAVRDEPSQAAAARLEAQAVAAQVAGQAIGASGVLALLLGGGLGTAAFFLE